MQANPHQIIFEILSIIGYKGDKDKFAKKFVNLILDQALLSALDGLSPKEKAEVKFEMNAAHGKDAATSILMRIISVEKYVSAVKKTTMRLLKDYLSTIIPTLYPHQKAALDVYLSGLRSGIYAPSGRTDI